MQALTPAQEELLDLIRRYIRRHREGPEQEWLAVQQNVSQPAIHTRLVSLKRRGLIDWKHNVPRSLRIGEPPPDEATEPPGASDE